jgi:hypothetical protein
MAFAQRRSIWAGVALVVGLGTAGLAAWADILPEWPDFRDTVTEVDEQGRLIFREHGRWRVWGIVPDMAALRRLAVGVELDCYDAGETGARGMGLSGTVVRAVRCEHNAPRPQGGWDLAERLLEGGHGVEICGETLGLLGTCPESAP